MRRSLSAGQPDLDEEWVGDNLEWDPASAGCRPSPFVPEHEVHEYADCAGACDKSHAPRHGGDKGGHEEQQDDDGDRSRLHGRVGIRGDPKKGGSSSDGASPRTRVWEAIDLSSGNTPTDDGRLPGVTELKLRDSTARTERRHTPRRAAGRTPIEPGAGSRTLARPGGSQAARHCDRRYQITCQRAITACRWNPSENDRPSPRVLRGARNSSRKLSCVVTR